MSLRTLELDSIDVNCCWYCCSLGTCCVIQTTNWTFLLHSHSLSHGFSRNISLQKQFHLLIWNVENERKIEITMTFTPKLKFLVIFNLFATVHSCNEVSKEFSLKMLVMNEPPGHLECDILLWLCDNVVSDLGHGQCDHVQWQGDGVYEDPGHGDHEHPSVCDWGRSQCHLTSEHPVSGHLDQVGISRTRYTLGCVIIEI